MKKQILNIIFDFGGVLYNINPLNAGKEFKKLANPNKVDKHTKTNFFKLLNLYEEGRISTPEFRSRIISDLDEDISDEMFDKAWNSILLGLKPEAIEIISSLKNNYNLTLLSNTNPLHYRHFYPECAELFDLFDNKFFSYRMGCKKPGNLIFKRVLAKTSYNPTQTIFIDDTIDNIVTAEKLNFLTHHYDENSNLSDFLHTV